MQMRVKRPSLNAAKLRGGLQLHPQTQFFLLGVTVPFILFWVSHLLIFSLPKQIFTLLEQNRTSVETDGYTLPWLYEAIFKLNQSNGIIFAVLGLLIFGFAVAWMLWMFKRYKVEGVKLGDVKLQSVLVSFLISVVVISILIAVFRSLVIYTLPDQIWQVVWGSL